ncbi:MAG: ribonuclease III [Clostridia bacterium]|nr:ribonuclease III [Clostridia bacterium]
MKGLKPLEEKLGYTFKNERLLITALTHPSYASDHHEDSYQRLEFLGDAVIELSVSRILFDRFTKMSEGQLTRMRAGLVREETLGQIALEWELGGIIRLSVGEEKSGGAKKPSILSDVVEAIIAAVYLDGGFGQAFELINRSMSGRLEELRDYDELDAKSRLQELLQARGQASPEYVLAGQQGPAHSPTFMVKAVSGEREIGYGAGSTKRQAQQAAAKAALDFLTMNCEGR